MDVLLIGNSTCHAADRIEHELDLQGGHLNRLPIPDLAVHASKDSVHLTNSIGEPISDHDAYLFRGMGRNVRELSVIARFLAEKGKLIVEPSLAEHGAYLDKFTPSMINPEIPVLPYRLVFSLDALHSDSLVFPVIVKSLDGSMGTRVRLVHDLEELMQTGQELGMPVIIQTYVQIEADYRVLVVGGKPLGAMKRYRTDTDFLTTRAGGKRESAVLPDDVLHMAVRAAAAANLEIAGVDLVEFEGRWYRLEVNMSPQFETFERVTGVNVAAAIVEHIAALHERFR